MNKQFDVFVKMKITEMSKTIHDMTYTYINPETKKPTDVPAKHYQDILKQPVEVMDYMVDEENKSKKKSETRFHISQDSFIKKFDEIKNNDSIMAELFDSADVKDDGFSLN